MHEWAPNHRYLCLKAKIGVHKKVCQSPKWADRLLIAEKDWQPTIKSRIDFLQRSHLLVSVQSKCKPLSQSIIIVLHAFLQTYSGFANWF